jgi:hypothetical protein
MELLTLASWRQVEHMHWRSFNIIAVVHEQDHCSVQKAVHMPCLCRRS